MHKHGAQGFNEFVLNNAKDFIRFKIQFSMEETKADPHRKAAVTKDLINMFGKIPDGFIRGEYIKEFCSLMQISEEMVIREVNNLMRTALKKNAAIPSEDASLLQQQSVQSFEEISQPNFFQNPDEEQEKNIIRILLEWGSKTLSNNKTVAEFLFDEIEISLIDNVVCAKIFNQFLQEFEQTKLFDSSSFINSPDEEISAFVAELLKDQYLLSPNWESKHQIFIKDREMNFEEDVNSSVHHFKLKKLLKLINQNLQKIKTEKNLEEEIQLQYIHLQLSVMKADLAKASGTVIRK
jgi:DNA primase